MARDPVTVTFGKVLNELPISIRELAKRSGVNRSTLQAARDGEFRLTPENTRKVIEALRATSDDMTRHADALEAAARKRGD